MKSVMYVVVAGVGADGVSRIKKSDFIASGTARMKLLHAKRKFWPHESGIFRGQQLDAT